MFATFGRLLRAAYGRALTFVCVRKGYRPIELPVNYRSRSFDEGKKVRMIRDPISWLMALARLRCERIDPMEVVERSRNNGKT